MSQRGAVTQPAERPFRPGIGGGDLLGPVVSFEGLANDDNGTNASDRSLPPDAEGDVGPRHYVQWVNTSLAIFDKQGTRLLGPLSGNVVWSGFGFAEGDDVAARLCDSENRGDPLVLYDQLADRWVLSQFAWRFSGPNPAPPFVQCFAVSATPDPSGRYFRYAFRMPEDLFNDYAKVAMWPDAYVLTDVATGQAAEADEDGRIAGAGVVALDRSDMLAGRPTVGVYVLIDGTPALLPVDLDGPAALPGARPLADPILVGLDDDEQDVADALELWRFHPDFADAGASVLSGPTLLPTAAFDSNVCPGFGCISQPGDAPMLDALSDRLMFRAEYRRFDDYDALALTHTTRADASERAALRWYELRDYGYGLVIARRGVLAPSDDKLNRWLGSAALDRHGDLGLAFSVSGAGPSDFPSIGYTGVPAEADAPMPGEGRLALGDGAQTAGRRWGDYGSLTVDPADGCSFWLTHEYYPQTGTDGWHTRIGSFRFPECGAVPTIDGAAREGEELAAAPGAWPELPGATFGYQWRRCGADGRSCFDVAGATGPAYRLTSSDVDWTMRVAVTAVAPEGTSSTLSRQTRVVVPVPAVGPVDLTATTSLSPSSAKPGDDILLTVQVSNRGGGTATGVQLAIDLPSQLELISSEADRGPGCRFPGALVCDLDFLPVARTATVTARLRVAGRGVLAVRATVRADQSDPDEATNTDTATIVAMGPPRLVLLESRVTESAAPRAIVTVTADVSIDEAAALTLVAVNSRGRQLPLLPGSSLAGRTLHTSATAMSGRAQTAGTLLVRARVPGRLVVRGSEYRLDLQARDADGQETSIAIPFTRGSG